MCWINEKKKTIIMHIMLKIKYNQDSNLLYKQLIKLPTFKLHLVL